MPNLSEKRTNKRHYLLTWSSVNRQDLSQTLIGSWPSKVIATRSIIDIDGTMPIYKIKLQVLVPWPSKVIAMPYMSPLKIIPPLGSLIQVILIIWQVIQFFSQHIILVQENKKSKWQMDLRPRNNSRNPFFNHKNQSFISQIYPTFYYRQENSLRI